MEWGWGMVCKVGWGGVGGNGKSLTGEREGGGYAEMIIQTLKLIIQALAC